MKTSDGSQQLQPGESIKTSDGSQQLQHEGAATTAPPSLAPPSLPSFTPKGSRAGRQTQAERGENSEPMLKVANASSRIRSSDAKREDGEREGKFIWVWHRKPSCGYWYEMPNKRCIAFSTYNRSGQICAMKDCEEHATSDYPGIISYCANCWTKVNQSAWPYFDADELSTPGISAGSSGGCLSDDSNESCANNNDDEQTNPG